MTAELQAKIDAVFDKGGALVYAGYVDDPRNTDDAWMETEVRNFHLDDDLAAQIPLEAGDDARHPTRCVGRSHARDAAVRVAQGLGECGPPPVPFACVWQVVS